MTRRRKILIAAAGALLLGGGALALALRDEWVPERSPAGRGRLVAERAGCFSCHGPAAGPAVGIASVEAEGAAAAPEGRLLATHEKAERVHSLFDDDAEEVREWIADGSRPRKADEPHPALAMPGFAGRLSPAEIDDLVAYVVLEGDAKRARPDRKLEPP
jgi:mono/diheme cytochrome c family protein